MAFIVVVVDIVVSIVVDAVAIIFVVVSNTTEWGWFGCWASWVCKFIFMSTQLLLSFDNL